MTEKPRLEPDLVRQFVGDAHGDLESVKALLATAPALVNAAWDWGLGDWETGLGAASHVGHRDIALFLLDRGARMDVFAAAMLGRLEIVQAIVGGAPGAGGWAGPHGIPLLAHAEAGGTEAEAVTAYLRSLGPAA